MREFHFYRSLRSARLLVHLFAIVASLMPVTSNAAQFVIDNFEARTTIDPWTVLRAAAGVTARAELGGGAGSSNAIYLDYSFSCAVTGSSCGQYAALNLMPPTALTAGKAIRFRTKSPADLLVAVRIVDQSNQTLQYRTIRPFSGYNSSNWYTTHIEIAKPQSYWGGVNTGILSGGVKRVQIVVESRSGSAVAGAIAVDDIEMLDAIPGSPALTYVGGLAVIDDFENRSTVLPWKVSKSPSVTASISATSVTGVDNSKGLGLPYQFTCTTSGSNCGQYVTANLSLPFPISSGASLSFQTRSAPAIRLSVRVTDESGQTLQYRVARPIEGFNPLTWYEAVVDLAHEDSYWGGANNGLIQGKIMSISVVAEKFDGIRSAGTVAMDQFAMHANAAGSAPLSYVDGKVVLDDFENRTNILPWKSWAAKSLGMSLGVQSGPGFSSTRGLAINYSFSCAVSGTTCGQYGAAEFPLPQQASPAEAISIMTKSPSESILTFNVVDASGQTLKYRTIRPLDGFNPDNWYHAHANLNEVAGFWGGANNGRIQGAIKSVRVVVESVTGIPSSGTVSVDNLTLHQERFPPSTTVFDNGVSVLDDFDSRPTVNPWFISTQTTNSSGAISSEANPKGGRSLALNYTFTCSAGECGRYVGANMRLPQPLTTASAIRMMVRTPAFASARFLVTDSVGQTFQFRLTRPLESTDASMWYEAIAFLDQPSEFWGGPADGIVRFPIVSMGVIASSMGSNQHSGSVLFDEIEAISSSAATFALSGNELPERIAPPSAQHISTRLTLAHTIDSSPATLDLAAQTGVGRLRVDLILESVEKPSGMDFRLYDDMLAGAEARDMEVLFILRQSYAAPNYDYTTPQGVAAFASFAEVVARRYAGRSVSYEVWNEPEEPTYWGLRTPNPVHYAALAASAVDAVHRGDPAALVSTAGISMFQYGYIRSMLQNGAGVRADAIGLHGYRENREPESIGESLVTSRAQVSSVLGRSSPLWMTEWGYSTPEIPGSGHDAAWRNRQANIAARSILSQCALDIPVVAWYKLIDSGSNAFERGHNFGLLDVNLQQKPAFKAVKQISDFSQGLLYTGLLRNVPHGLHVMRFDGQGSKGFVVWNSETARSITFKVPATGLQSARNVQGNSITGTVDATNPALRVFTLTEAAGPVYLRY